jgi:hypothetical protein
MRLIFYDILPLIIYFIHIFYFFFTKLKNKNLFISIYILFILSKKTTSEIKRKYVSMHEVQTESFREQFWQGSEHLAHSPD